MKPYYPIVLIVVCFTTVHGFAGMTEGQTSTPPLKPGWNDAPTDTDGNVIAVWEKYNGRGEGRRVGEEGISIRTEYGFALACWKEFPKAFYVFDNIKKKYYATRDFKQFVERLFALPDGKTVAWVDSCTTSSWDDLPTAQQERLWAVLKQKKIDATEASGGHHFCVCAATSIQWLDVPGKKGNEHCEWVFTK